MSPVNVTNDSKYIIYQIWKITGHYRYTIGFLENFVNYHWNPNKTHYRLLKTKFKKSLEHVNIWVITPRTDQRTEKCSDWKLIIYCGNLVATIADNVLYKYIKPVTLNVCFQCQVCIVWRMASKPLSPSRVTRGSELILIGALCVQ